MYPWKLMESYCPPILQIRNQSRAQLVLILAAVLFPASANAVLPEIVDYNFHIKPILSDRCYACHGPDEETREGGFRLDLRDSAFGEADSGAHPIIPIKPAQSEILSRLTSADEDFRMPPTDSKLSVSEEEIALLRRWIEQGAEWKQHWAFLPLQVPDGKYIANSIDRFVLDRLEHEGLESTGEATREELIRRVSFDLTGLPPTVEEIDTFSSDSTENAYERVVDRLLQSPDSASGWQSNGSMLHVMRIPTVIKRIDIGRFGSGETGSCRPLMRTFPTTNSLSGNWQAISCRMRRTNKYLRLLSIDYIGKPMKEGASRKNSAMSM